MRPALLSVALRNGGVFTRHQAKSAGYTERELKTLTKPGGSWVIVHRGVYAERELWNSVGEDGRYALRVRAALLTQVTAAVPSHSSSAVLLGMPMRPQWTELVHVTRWRVTGGRTDSGIKHHLARYDDHDVRGHSGMLVMGLARSAVDIAREHGFEDGLVAVDAALRMGAHRSDLERALEKMRCWPGVTTARAAIAAGDGGAQNIGESLMRSLILELRLGEPETQFVAREGRRHAAVDVRVGRHLFEFDGKIKYVGRDQGGVATQRPEEVLWAEKQREDWLRAYDGGYGMSRVIWQDLLGRQREETKRRLEREFIASHRIFGHLL